MATAFSFNGDTAEYPVSFGWVDDEIVTSTGLPVPEQITAGGLHFRHTVSFAVGADTVVLANGAMARARAHHDAQTHPTLSLIHI